MGQISSWCQPAETLGFIFSASIMTASFPFAMAASTPIVITVKNTVNYYVKTGC